MQQVPELAGRELTLTALSGGITNRNFRVDAAGTDERWVIRLAGNDTHLLGISREVEHAATVAAAGVGVGPEVTAFIRPEGYLVTRFIVGSPVSRTRPSTGRRRSGASPIRSGASTTARPSRGCSSRSGSPRRIGRSPWPAASPIPPEYDLAAAVGRRIEGALLADPLELRPCHNDLLNANFIDDGARIRIIDWEYAGMGDPFFDLGNFSINHELTRGRGRDPAGGLRRRGPARPARAADPHAGRVRLPRGDVGRPPAGDQHARRRLRRVRRRRASTGCSRTPPRRGSSARSARSRRADRERDVGYAASRFAPMTDPSARDRAVADDPPLRRVAVGSVRSATDEPALGLSRSWRRSPSSVGRSSARRSRRPSVRGGRQPLGDIRGAAPSGIRLAVATDRRLGRPARHRAVRHRRRRVIGARLRPRPSSADPSGDPVLVGAGDIADCGLDDDSGDGERCSTASTGPSSPPATTPTRTGPPSSSATAMARPGAASWPAPGRRRATTTGTPGTSPATSVLRGRRRPGRHELVLVRPRVLARRRARLRLRVGRRLRSRDSTQGRWLAADLAASTARCTLAIWHHPRFSSGDHGNDPIGGAVLDRRSTTPAPTSSSTATTTTTSGSRRRTRTGRRTAARGLREFVVGTGGAALRASRTRRPTASCATTVDHGVIRFTLHAASYDWTFIPTTGGSADTGSGACH